MMSAMDANTPAPRRVSMWVTLRAILWSLVFVGIFIFWIPALNLQMWKGYVWRFEPRTVLGLLIASAGVSLMIACIVQFVRHGEGTPAPMDSPQHLVVRGPYRYVRNPMYLGGLLVLLGQIVLRPSWELLMYSALWFGAMAVLVVTYEEPTLHVRFGDAYADYRDAVPRWIPRLGKPYGGS